MLSVEHVSAELNHSIQRIMLLATVVASLSACARQLPRPQPVEGPHSLIISVANVRCCQGNLRLALYNSASSWMKANQMIRGRIVVVQAQQETIEIHGLPVGAYAIVVYQDMNSNGKLDKRFWFFPKEPYGFSNVGRAYKPPSFKKASINLPDTSAIDIRLAGPAI